MSTESDRHNIEHNYLQSFACKFRIFRDIDEHLKANIQAIFKTSNFTSRVPTVIYEDRVVVFG